MMENLLLVLTLHVFGICKITKMKKDEESTKKVARGKFLTALGGLFLIPLASRAEALGVNGDTTDDGDDYQILLKPDGSTVKVKQHNLKKSKTVKNKLSNPALKSWLKK